MFRRALDMCFSVRTLTASCFCGYSTEPFFGPEAAGYSSIRNSNMYLHRAHQT